MKPTCHLSGLTLGQLREVLSYSHSTGEFTWQKRLSGKRGPGQIAGYIKCDGYRRIGINGTKYPAHWLAWFFVHGAWPSETIDHINGCRDDNRIENLRPATTSENAQNQRLPANRYAPGVSLTSGGFIAKIRHRGVRIYLGCFRTPEEASAAYLKEKSRIHPYARAGL